MADLWAQELLARLRLTRHGTLVAHARIDDHSAFSPGRPLLRELIGDLPAATIAQADDPLAELLLAARSHGVVLDALMREVWVPPTADDLDGPRQEMLAATFARMGALSDRLRWWRGVC